MAWRCVASLLAGPVDSVWSPGVGRRPALAEQGETTRVSDSSAAVPGRLSYQHTSF